MPLLDGSSKSIRLLLIISVLVTSVSVLIYLLIIGQENAKSTLDVQQNTVGDNLGAKLGSNLYTDQIIAKCGYFVNDQYKGLDSHCTINALRDLAKKEEQRTVLQAFDGIISKLDESGGGCHDEAHHLGLFLYAYTGNLTKALSHAEQKCGGAVYHGVMISYFLTEKIIKKSSPEKINITNLCPTYSNPYAIERWQCLHGIGHGLTASYEYNVLSAVQRCEEFQTGWEQISCSKGAFMENEVHYYETGSGDFKNDDRFYPCDSTIDKYAPACYHYHASYILGKEGFPLKGVPSSFLGAFKGCDKIIPERFVKYCYYGMGRQFEYLIGIDIKYALTLCQAGQAKYASDCFQGMVMTNLNNDRNTDEGFNFCKALPDQFKPDCYNALGKWVVMLQSTADGRGKECSKAESSNYFDLCMKATLKDIPLL